VLFDLIKVYNVCAMHCVSFFGKGKFVPVHVIKANGGEEV
jgi:hypothetical protein